MAHTHTTGGPFRSLTARVRGRQETREIKRREIEERESTARIHIHRENSQISMGPGGGKKGPEDAGLGGEGAARTGSGIGGTGARMAYADHAMEEEADAVEMLVSEWTKNGVLGQGTKEARGPIKHFNVVKDAVAWRPVAPKVPATNQGVDEVENQAAMAWRLATQAATVPA